MNKPALIGVVIAIALVPPAQAQLRPMVYAETTVDAPVAEVWTDWTTVDGVTGFWAAAAEIELRPGGAYALEFAPNAPVGSRGNDAGTVLGFEPERMLHVSWAMPPYMPEIRPHLTALQIRLTPVDDDTTRIRLYHTGFGDGAEWAKGEAYFEETWPAVLQAYKTSLNP